MLTKISTACRSKSLCNVKPIPTFTNTSKRNILNVPPVNPNEVRVKKFLTGANSNMKLPSIGRGSLNVRKEAAVIGKEIATDRVKGRDNPSYDTSQTLRDRWQVIDYFDNLGGLYCYQLGSMTAGDLMDKTPSVLMSYTSIQDALLTMADTRTEELLIETKEGEIKSLVDIKNIFDYLFDSGILPKTGIGLDHIEHLIRSLKNATMDDVIRRNHFTTAIAMLRKQQLLIPVRLHLIRQPTVPIIDDHDHYIGVLRRQNVLHYLLNAPHGQATSFLKTEPFNQRLSSLLHLFEYTRNEGISEKDTLLDALRAVHGSPVKGLPVVDSEGKILTNFSDCDILGIQESDWFRLRNSVVDFLRWKHETLKDPIVCLETDTVKQALLKMMSADVKQIHVGTKSGAVYTIGEKEFMYILFSEQTTE